jgi:ATP-dependent helicase IRC3
VNPAPTLRPYQVDALTAVETARAAGLTRILVKKPTGTGKTVMFAAMPQWGGLAAWLGTFPVNQRRMLVIAHREELLDQAREKIQAANPGLIVMVEQADRHASRHSDVIVASIQTLAASKFKRLKLLLQTMTFRLVIVDEAHHAAASTYRTALVHLGFLPAADASDKHNIEAIDHDDVAVMEQALEGWDKIAPRDRLLVGVTATPNRSDSIGLGCVFQSIAYSYALRQAIADEWLVPISAWVVETRSSLDDVRTSHGDFNQKELGETVNNPERNKLAVAAWQEHAAGLSTLAFTVTVAHAHALAQAFTDAGIPAAAISGETPKDERRETLAAYTRGEILVLTNCMVLTEGTDLPRTGCILHAKPTKSATLYEQMTGRGLRLFPNKTECVVIDLVDIARRHSLQSSPVLYGLPPSMLANGEKLEQLADVWDELLEKHPNLEMNRRMTLGELRAYAEKLDIWAVPSLGAFGSGRAMDWIKMADEDYRLQYPWSDGTETMTVSKNMLGRWDLTITLRPKHVQGEAPKPGRQRTLAKDLESAVLCADLGEQFVLQERRSVMRLAGKDEPWRSAPASGKQLAALSKMRVPFKSGITKGEASNLLDIAIARRSGGRR